VDAVDGLMKRTISWVRGESKARMWLTIRRSIGLPTRCRDL